MGVVGEERGCGEMDVQLTVQGINTCMYTYLPKPPPIANAWSLRNYFLDQLSVLRISLYP